MNYLKYLVGFICSKVRYSNKVDPFSQFEKMEAVNKTSWKENKKLSVLILPIRVSPTSNLFEGLIGYSMVNQGHQVTALLEHGHLEISENNTINKKNWLHNCLSYYEQSRFGRVFELETLGFIDTKFTDDLERYDLSKLFEYKYKDIAVGKHAKFGLMRYLMIETITDEHKRLLIRFLKTAIKTVDSTENAITKVTPDVALISHGCYSTWGSALDVLKKHSIKVSVWGRGYIGQGNIIISHGHSYLYNRTLDNRYYWESNELSSKEKKDIELYYKKKREPNSNVDFVNYYSEFECKNDDFIKLKEKCANYKVNYGIYPNIPWDGTMYSSTNEFPTVRSFVELIHRLVFKYPDYHFIIRNHPAEKARKDNLTRETFLDLIYDTFDNIPSNLTILEPESTISSYDVSSISKLAIMYGSTLALEFIMNRHPVLQVGLSNVSNKDLILDCETENEVYNILEKYSLIDDARISEEHYKRVCKYANFWVNDFHYKENSIELKNLLFNGFKFKSKHEFLESDYSNEILNCLFERNEIFENNK